MVVGSVSVVVHPGAMLTWSTLLVVPVLQNGVHLLHRLLALLEVPIRLIWAMLGIRLPRTCLTFTDRASESTG